MNVAMTVAPPAPMQAAAGSAGSGTEAPDGPGFAQALQQARAAGAGGREPGAPGAPGRTGAPRDEGTAKGKAAGAADAARSEAPGRPPASDGTAAADAAPAGAAHAADDDTTDTPPGSSPGTDGPLAWLWQATAERAVPGGEASTARTALPGTDDEDTALADASSASTSRRPGAGADGRWTPGAAALAGADGAQAAAAADAARDADLANDGRDGGFAPALAAASAGQAAATPLGPAPGSSAAAALAAAAGLPGSAPSAAADLPAAAGAVVEQQLHAPLHSPGFAPALGAQLTLLVREGVTEARLHLNPAEMGPIAVQIQLDGTQARVEMVAEQALTRQVLEQSMPSLASALRDSGLTLAGGGVFQQSARQGRPGDESAPSAGDGRPGADGATGADGTHADALPVQAARPRGVVDLYA
jgi:flagellar hook-length control protein FliK